MMLNGIYVYIAATESILMFSFIVYLLYQLRESPELLLSSFYTHKLKIYSFAFFAVAFLILSISYSFSFFAFTASIASVSEEDGLILALFFLDAYFLIMAS